jgi:hypothetical protein
MNDLYYIVYIVGLSIYRKQGKNRCLTR